jgi:hypothetical protein
LLTRIPNVSYFHKSIYLFSKQIPDFYGTKYFYFRFHKSPRLFSSAFLTFMEPKIIITIFIKFLDLVTKFITFTEPKVSITV